MRRPNHGAPGGPVVASASGASRGNCDYECDTYELRVRQHADGRAIVYAILDAASAWTGSEDYRAGELLDDGAEIATAISRVGREAGFPASVIRECIADLPAVVL